MDKNNKNRTDLLAAGRKKLQQFRQKKDGKGGKPSGKPGKSGRDGGADASAATTSTSEKVLDKEVSVSDAGNVVPSLELHPPKGVFLSSNVVATVDQSSEDGIRELVSVPRDEKLGVEDSRRHNKHDDHAEVPLYGGGATNIHEDVEISDSEASDAVIFEEKFTASNRLVPVGLSSQGDSVREEQEVGSSDARQIDGTSEIRVERLDSDVGNMVDVKEVTNEATLYNQSDAVSSTVIIGSVDEAPERGANTDASEPLPESEQLYIVSTELRGDGISDGSASSSEGAQADKNSYKDDVDGSHVYENDGIPKPLGSKILKLSFGSNPYSITLSQLADIIKGLDKDEFRFLYSLQESPEYLTKSPCTGAPEFSYLENIKELLYLTSFAKDANELQLYEQVEIEMQLRGQIQKLIDEISVTGAALSEAQGKNEFLSDQLAESRSELQEFSSGKAELETELQGSKAELQELSVKVDDLQNKLGMAGEELGMLASELADGRNSLSALQVQNESLNGRLSLVMEEKMSLVENKEYLVQENERMAAELVHCKASSELVQSQNGNLTEYLSSVKEENRKLGEENERLVSENGRLLSDLTDCNSMVQALRAEASELTGLLVATEEDKKKLEKAQVNFLSENEKLAVDLVNTQSSMDALQIEMSNLNGRLSSLMEERNKLEDEKQYLLSKNKNESHELAAHKFAPAGLQADSSNAAIVHLQEASSTIDQLIQENVLLKINLELQMAEISNSEDTGGLVESGKPKLETTDSLSLIPRTDVSGTSISEAQKILSKSSSDGPHLDKLVLDNLNDPSAFEFWKIQLNEATEVLQLLENAVDRMQSAPLNKSSGKHVAHGVSKLIQAFEIKGHTDDKETSEQHSSETLSSVDPYMRAKELTEKLRVGFKQMLQQSENMCVCLDRERKNRLSTEVLNAELKGCCDFWETHGNNLEAENIELMCLHEALKQHISDSEESVRKILVSYNDLQKQEITLDGENSQLKAKLRNFEDKVAELKSHLDDISRSSQQMVCSISSTVETLHKEVGDMGLMLKTDWNTFVTQITDEVGKLDLSIEALFSIALASNKGNFCRIGTVFAASIDVATKAIEGLQGQLQVTQSDHHSILSRYTGLKKDFSDLQENNEVLVDILDKTYWKLRKIVDSSGHVAGTESVVENEKLVHPLDPGVFYCLLEKLQDLLDEKLLLLSNNNKLQSDRMDQVREIDALKRRCLHLDAILKLFKNVGEEFMLDAVEINPMDPVSGLESFFSILTQKYKETTEQVRLSMGNLALNEMQFGDLRGELDYLSMLLVQYENDNLVLKESWRTTIKGISALQSELLEKVGELEQSEQRVSSLREKLGIAVSKGKGLIVQRDNLKQSLAETCNQLEKCLQELQLKDVSINELETKLKTYSEAGERMEALKSELAYIRNSATALRESFILKDSVLQRIEEILEDLELPEHFHSGDIIEKVHWLAKSVSGNTSVVDWDQKSSVGGSYPESGFTSMDGWKDETQPNQDSVDDFRRRYEELQGKFYGLAEHNDMLEQSLMERNHLLHRWEEVLGKIEIPSHLSSLEPEDKIQWLGHALSDSQDQCQSLQKRIDYLDTLCGSVTVELDESRIRISELESAYRSVITEKEFLSKNLETLTNDCGEFSEKAVSLETENENLRTEIALLQKELHQKRTEKENLLKELTLLQKEFDEMLVDVDHAHHVHGRVRRLHDLICDVLQDSVTDGLEFASDNVEILEHLLRKLIEKYRTLMMVGQVNSDAVDVSLDENASHTLHEEKTRDSEESLALRKRLEDTLGELMCLKEERERFFNDNQSLVHEVETLGKKKSELQELLNHEEQKSASLREKLNIAVKKGKSLVQQRDNLKQVIDEVNAEVERLKSEITVRENAIADYEQKVVNLSMSLERIKGTEAECALLRDSLSYTERHLEDREHMLTLIADYFKDFEVDLDLGSGNPFEKLQAFGKFYQELRAALDSSQQESRKSKRAAELLLAELNEVQERNDSLQEDLIKIGAELSELSKEKELYEAEKSEALVHLEKLAAARLEERDHLFAEVLMLRSGVDQVRMEISDIDNSLAEVLSKHMEILHNLDASIKSCLEPTLTLITSTMPTAGSFSGLNFPKLESKISVAEASSLKERLQRHYHELNEEASHIFGTMKALYAEVVSLKESFGSKERELVHLKSIVNDKDSELLLVKRNLWLLYEACNISVAEIENWKAQQSEIIFPNEASHIKMDSQTIVGKDASMLETHPCSEQDIMTVREKLLSMLKDLITKQNAILEDSQKEMKALVLNLQKELHEKDIQREQICSELVGQIKEAKVEVMTHLQELESMKTQANDLHCQLNVKEEERYNLGKRIEELEHQEAIGVELTQRVSSLTDALAAKDQEIESLMQALDEEESQMEGLSNKIMGLEKDLQKKNQDLEKVEASRGKALKKLSVTVSKFDELHNLSETVLSEIEKLQSQLQERNEEISFLRQEVTRCTNEELSATQMGNKKHSDEVLEVLTLLDSMISQVQVPDMQFSDSETNQVRDYEVKLQKKISFILSELEKMRALVQDRDLLLGVERGRVEEMIRKEKALENSLLEKESQLTTLWRLADSGQATSSSSEIVEVDPLINKRAATGIVAPQVRGGRKMNSDHVAIAVDMDPTSPVEDDDDDKAHGFKSLTTSRIVPRFTRPVSDMIDGLWMSCDRTLMRQPTLRLGVIIYWAIIHSLLAAFVV